MNDFFFHAEDAEKKERRGGEEACRCASLPVFAIFSVLYLGEKFTLNHAIGFALIAGGAWFVFRG